MQKNNKILLLLLNWLIYLFPLFYILGNFFINTSVVLISITGLVLYRWKIFDFKKDNLLFLISSFFLIIIIFTFFESISNPGNVKLYKSIIFLRYFILLLVVRYALINDHINLKKFLISCLVCSTLISLDVIFQFITGKNIIGLKSTIQHRSSFFGNEYVAGGFIQRFSILGFFFTLIIFKKRYLKILIPTTFLILCFFATLFSGNKMPAVLLLIFMFITLFFFFLNFGIYKNRVFIFSSLAVLAIVFFQSEKLYSLYLNKIKNSYYFAHSQALGAIPNTFIGAMPNAKIIYSEVTRDYSELNKYKGKTWFHHTEEFKDKEKYRYIGKQSVYNHIYITSLDLFLERPLTGRGIKSFRETCKERVHLPNRICSTHQHNYHLQILNDTGLIGYLIFFGTFFFVILKCFRKNNLRSNIYFYAALSVLIIEFIPLRSTGGFFSTINSAYIFFMIGILFGLKGLGYKSENY